MRADVERLAAQLDAAIARLEGSDAATDWKLRARLLRLEAEYLTARQPKPAARPASWLRRVSGSLLEVLERLSPIATPIIIALFGILLTGTTQEFLDLRKVELAEQELDLATIQALDGHLTALRAENINRQTADQLASQIAYFGPRAIVPLVAELRTVKTEADPRALAIKSALQVSPCIPASARSSRRSGTGQKRLFLTLGKGSPKRPLT